MSTISLQAVDAVLILSNDSSSPRLLAKYYSSPHTTASSSSGLANTASTAQTDSRGAAKGRHSDIKKGTSSTSGGATSSITAAAAAAAGAPTGALPGRANHPYVTLKDQLAFEKGLVQKTTQKAGGGSGGAGGDIILYDGRIVVFKTVANLTIYVVGPAHENELLLLSVAVCLKDVLTTLFVTPHDQHALDKQTMLENYDLAALAVDEIVDDGVIFQTDRDTIIARISQKPQVELPAIADMELSEKTLANIWDFARMTLKGSGF